MDINLLPNLEQEEGRKALSQWLHERGVEIEFEYHTWRECFVFDKITLAKKWTFTGGWGYNAYLQGGTDDELSQWLKEHDLQLYVNESIHRGGEYYIYDKSGGTRCTEWVICISGSEESDLSACVDMKDEIPWLVDSADLTSGISHKISE